MWSQVFLLPKGGSVPADSWQEEGDAPEASRARWERSASTWPRQLMHGLTVPLEYFICLNGDPLEAGYDSVSLRTQLNNARNHAWGAGVYVAVDQRYDMQLAQIEARPARVEWFQTMVELGVADVIELPLPLSDDNGPQPKLRMAAARSQERLAIIDACDRQGAWKCLVPPPPNPIQKSFLSPFLVAAPAGGGEENYLLVLNSSVRKSHREAQHEFVIRTADTTPGSQILVAYVDETGQEPPDDLKQLCKERELILVPNSFRGLFELYFFVRRLAQGCGRGAWRQEEWSEAVEVVSVAPRPTFAPPSRRQSLLVTHAFVYDNGCCPICHDGAMESGDAERAAEAYCFEAARDFYELTRDLPPETAVHVYPAVTCEVLTRLLGGIDGLTVWMHIGHGKQGEGLHESGCADHYADPEKWLSCFEKHSGPLSLVCFAACESTAIAKYFAEHGAGVSVGFRENVPLEDCRSVARELVKVALTSNGNRNAILTAFERSRHASDAGAVAFCANH
jgi:hypothetical protein